MMSRPMVENDEPPRSSTKMMMKKQIVSDVGSSGGGEDSAPIGLEMFRQPIQIENKRVRNMFSEKQIEILERAFEQTHYPDLGMREDLSRLLNLKPLRIQVWFQNRRAKYRKFDFCSKPNQKQAQSSKRTWFFYQKEKYILFWNHTNV